MRDEAIKRHPIYDDISQRKVQMKEDGEQLNILSIFYFVFSGFCLIAFAITLMQRRMMAGILTPSGVGSSNLPGMFSLMSNLIWLIGAICLCMFVANLACAIFLRQRRYRTFTLIVAGIDCLHLPIGTILGVFTIVVLQRDSVRSLYSSVTEEEDACLK